MNTSLVRNLKRELIISLDETEQILRITKEYEFQSLVRQMYINLLWEFKEFYPEHVTDPANIPMEIEAVGKSIYLRVPSNMLKFHGSDMYYKIQDRINTMGFTNSVRFVLNQMVDYKGFTVVSDMFIEASIPDEELNLLESLGKVEVVKQPEEITRTVYCSN